MACYGINKVKLHRHHRDNKDAMFIKQAYYSLPEGAVVDLTQDDVAITIDGRVYAFPHGSFKWNGDEQHYAYKTGPGVKPQVHAKIDLKRSKWSLKLMHIDADFVDNSDGVDIALTIGNYEGSENVVLKSKNRHGRMLMYKRKPKVRCGHARHADDDEAYESDHRYSKAYEHEDKDDDHKLIAKKHTDKSHKRSARKRRD